MLPKTLRFWLFDTLSIKTMRYVRSVPTRKAKGLVARVYQMIAEDFFHRETDEHILNHVLSFTGVVEQPHRQGQQRIDVLLVDSRQRLGAAALELPFEYFIFQHSRPVRCQRKTIVF